MAYFGCPTCQETVRGPHECGGETVWNRCRGCSKRIGVGGIICGDCSRKITQKLASRRA
jgi:hypothetical protein